jgi:uncharacterized membrane protein YphA (DoxX/SURF4 family)
MAVDWGAMAALLILMVRWFIAGVFLRAGVVKLGDQAEFRAAVANYQLLPLRFVGPVAVVLPVAEIAGGVLLATGILTAPAAMLLGLLLAAFAVAIAINLARGRSFDCGCSGSSTPSKISWRHVAVDLVLAAGAALVAVFGPVAASVWPGPLTPHPLTAPAGSITPTVIAILIVLMAMLAARMAASLRVQMAAVSAVINQSTTSGS